MVIFLLAGLLLIGIAALLALRAITMPRLRAAERIGAIDAYGYEVAPRPEEPQASEHGRLEKLAKLIGDVAVTRLTKVSEAELRKELMAAGLYSVSPRAFLGYRVLASILLPSLLLWLGVGGSSPLMLLLLAAVSIVGGWTIPLTLVRRRATRRLARIDRELPELIDLLVVTVEAGLSFSASLTAAAERLQGPLGDEVRLAIQEQSLGLATNEALSNMLERSDTPALRSFVRSVIQGESLGVSIGTILRSVATEMRKRRRQSAEERAQKAPVKILFPLVFLIFPAVFIVLLGPAVFEYLQTFHG